MKIIEVRDGFISFEANKSAYLSSFIKVEGQEKSYICQVNQIKKAGETNIAQAKILFVYIDGNLYNYDKTEPPQSSEAEVINSDIILDTILSKQPVIIGKTLDNSSNIVVDYSAFNKKFLISIDDKNIHNILVQNFGKQFKNLGLNTLTIDTLGVISGEKFIPGKNFRLPLNTQILSFIYDSCLKDATKESKETIAEIFKELAKYSKTVPFVPFETLKAIVDDMVDKQHIFKLLVLKNKLAKLKQLNFFATSKEEAENLNNIIKSENAIIDLSGVEPVFQDLFIKYIYRILRLYNDKTKVLFEVSNTVSKSALKTVLTEPDIQTTIITHSNFHYLKDMQPMFDSFIIEPSKTNNSIFKAYETFLSSMEKGWYLILGEAVNYVPIVSKAQIIDEIISNDSVELEADDTQNEIATADYEASEEVEFKDVVQNEETEQSDDTEFEEQTEEVEDIAEVEIQDEITTQEELIAAIDAKSNQVLNEVSEIISESEPLDTSNIFDNEDDTENIPHETSIIEEQPENIEQTELSEADLEQQDTDTSNNIEDLVQDDAVLLEEQKENAAIDELPNEAGLETEQENIEIETIDENNIAETDNTNLDVLTESTEDINDGSGEQILDEISDAQIQDNVIQEAGDSTEENAEHLDSTDIHIEDSLEDMQVDESPESDNISIELDSSDSMMLEEMNSIEDNTEELPPPNLDIDLSEPKILPLSEDGITNDFDEIVELDPSELDENDIVVDISEGEEQNIDEAKEQEIINDVDKVYTTIKEDEENDSNLEVLEEISDSDLDLIDELNSDDSNLEELPETDITDFSDSQPEEGILNEYIPEVNDSNDDSHEILEKKDSNTPIVPVYDADIPQEDMVVSDPIQQGDAVSHAKYGNGVVEKMIKYGNKTLFAINFENIGRRLLDPTLTEIKRV